MDSKGSRRNERQILERVNMSYSWCSPMFDETYISLTEELMLRRRSVHLWITVNYEEAK